MKTKFIASVLILQIFLSQLSFAQTGRGVSNIKTERKIALIIGNTNYDTSIGRLTNPVNDAKDMADALRRLGFSLVGGKPQLDVNRRQMLELVREFGREIKQGGIGFFYFSGHGVQVNKENYIIPITDTLHYEDDAETEAVKVDAVTKEMELAENRLNILVLDACRNNALPKRKRNAEKGLTEPARKPEGTFIAFSASDGQTASDGTDRNGLFTQELLKNLEKPNFRLDDVFRSTRNEVKKLSNGTQIPMLSDSTSEAIFLKATDNVANQTQPAETAVNKNKIDSEYFVGTWKWKGIERGTSAEEIWNFQGDGKATFKTTGYPLLSENWSFSNNVLYEVHSDGTTVKSRVEVIDEDNFKLTVLEYSKDTNAIGTKRQYVRQKKTK